MPASGLYQGPVWDSACCLRPELLPANIMLKRQEFVPGPDLVFCAGRCGIIQQ